MARKTAISESLLSIADISRHFSLPESTTRYYCKRFAAFIPSVGEGRRRRYRPETLEVIAAILEQMQKSRTAAAVEDALLARFPRNAVALAGNTPLQAAQPPAQDFFPSAALQLMERQATALEGIAQLLHAVVERLPAQASQTASGAAGADGQNADLRQELDTLRLLLHSSEKTQQADLEQLRQWMGRVVRSRGTADTPAEATGPATKHGKTTPGYG
ncbi:MerR family transcriptional regulator [Desulfovibrio sp.]|uniref:MerR family transcriptional regulator n=1 Tax=Desulfovibrio sp. TaxID=885 RepID=UPI0025BB25A2|nr:MerR family transcriptional regulator [Desulfovibrio sp.]